MAKTETKDNNSLTSKTTNKLFIDALFSSIGDGAIATDEFSRIVRINSVGLSILGLKEQEVVGKWYPSIVKSVGEDGQEVKLMERLITKAYITGKPVTGRAYYLHKDGHKIPVSVTASPILLKGRPIGAINLYRDITQEYEIDRMKSEFISLASHQLRTPLSSIKTYSHMLLEGYMGKINRDQRFALKSVIDASDRMNQLTDTLLNITRIESGSMTISKKVVDLKKLAKKVVSEQSIDAETKNIAVKLRLQDKPAVANTDPFITKEIMSNLVSNALKYTPPLGRVTISIKTDKDRVVCCVSDTGIGIPKQSQEKIFNKFFRAPNVLARDTTGTGLGLYLIKSLADRINIPIWFESITGKGSKFYFSLPACMPKNTNKTTKESGKSL